MKKILLLLAVGFVGVPVAAQTPIHVSIETKASAREQIDTAFPLIRAIERAKDPAERQLAMMKAVSHLEAVPRVWPRDREAIVRAGLIEADVFARNNAMRNALEVLDRIQGEARRSAQQLQIAGRRGTLLAKLGRTEEAATVFAAAMAMHVDAPRDRLPILSDAAAFYFFQKRNADLAHVLRESATLETNELSAATSIARSLEADMRDGNLAEARKDYTDLAQRYERARHLPVAAFGSGDAAALQNIRATLDRYRAQLGSS